MDNNTHAAAYKTDNEIYISRKMNVALPVHLSSSAANRSAAPVYAQPERVSTNLAIDKNNSLSRPLTNRSAPRREMRWDIYIGARRWQKASDRNAA